MGDTLSSLDPTSGNNVWSDAASAVSDVGTSVGDFGAAMDPTTSEGLTNIGTSIGTGGISGLGTLLGGANPSDEFANLDDSINEWLSNLDDRAIQPALEGLQEAFSGAFGPGGVGGGVNTELIGERFEQIAAPGIATGQQAQELQAALSGASGPEAQMQAFQTFQDSPGTEFLRERGMRGINSRAAQTGRGGGGLMAELSKFNQGLALQDLDRQQQQLGQLAQQGLQAGGLGTSLTGIESGAIASEQAAAANQQAAQQNFLGQLAALGVSVFGRPGTDTSSTGDITATGGLRTEPEAAARAAPGIAAPGAGGPPSPLAAGATPGPGLVPGQAPMGQGMATPAIAPPRGIAPQGSLVNNQMVSPQGVRPGLVGRSLF